ncbi:MAG: O-antigen ligase family protein [Candidatus Coatesbacteria bacterium]|nr:O-antigen ligase family protein [Candidatus Coatesbacteria bacterium]
MRYVASFLCLIAFGYLFWAMVPEPLGIQITVSCLFAAMLCVALFSARRAAIIFAFLIPLLGIVPRIWDSPWISMLVFGFLGLMCGLYLKRRTPSEQNTDHAGSLPLKNLVPLIACSGLITVWKYVDFYPFSGEPLRDWVVNAVGTLSDEAINNTMTVGLAYISGIALLLVLPGIFSSKDSAQRTGIQIRIAWSIVIAGFISNLFALWQLFADEYLVIGFITGTYTDSNALGVCSTLILPYCIGLIFVSSDRARLFLVPCALLSIGVTFLARSRAGVLGTILFLISLFVWLRRSRPSRGERDDSARRSLKIMSVLLVLFAVMILLHHVNRLEEVPMLGDALVLLSEPSEESLEHLLRHRLHQWVEALDMCSDYPITGVGLGAYIIELPNYYFRNQGKLFMIDTAGSLPLQVASELGMVGLVLALMYAIYVVRTGLCLVLRRPEEGQEAEYRLIGCVSLGILASLLSMLFGAHILFFEYNYLLAVSISLVVASSLSLCPKSRPQGGRIVSRLVPVAVVVVLVVFAANSLGSLSIAHERDELGWQFEYGIFKKEDWGGEFPFWWTQREAGVALTVKGRVLHFSVFCAHPDADERPVKVSIILDGRTVETLDVTRDRWRDVSLKMPEGRSEVSLRLSVDRTFNHHELGLGPDRRDLGVAIAKFHWS